MSLASSLPRKPPPPGTWQQQRQTPGLLEHPLPTTLRQLFRVSVFFCFFHFFCFFNFFFFFCGTRFPLSGTRVGSEIVQEDFLSPGKWIMDTQEIQALHVQSQGRQRGFWHRGMEAPPASQIPKPRFRGETLTAKKFRPHDRRRMNNRLCVINGGD